MLVWGLTPKPGIQSSALMGWVKSTETGNVCWISVPPTNFSSLTPGIGTNPSTSVLGTEMVIAPTRVT